MKRMCGCFWAQISICLLSIVLTIIAVIAVGMIGLLLIMGAVTSGFLAWRIYDDGPCNNHEKRGN